MRDNWSDELLPVDVITPPQVHVRWLHVGLVAGGWEGARTRTQRAADVDAGDVFAVRLPDGNTHSVVPPSSVCECEREREKTLENCFKMLLNRLECVE